MLYKLLFLVIVGCVAATTTDEKNVEGRIPVPVPNISTTAVPPNPPPTNATSTTTLTPPTSKTTTKPTTEPSTTTPITTTSKPSPPPNSTTTEKPTTTSPTTTTQKTTPVPTTLPPSPTPVPTKPNDPIPGTWMVNYTDGNNTFTNRTCVVITLATQIEIPYKSGKTNNTGYINIQPNVTTATGSCGNILQSITLQWKNNENNTNNLTLTFERKNVNSTKFDLAAISIAVIPDNFTLPGYNGTIKLGEKTPLFNTSLQHSYKCFKKQTFNLTEDNSNVTAGFIHLQHVQLQAFRNTTGIVFAEAEDCAPYETPDVVPIAVGCALVALIIIVLVAYLIGRRRNQARGYLSMFSAEKKEADYIPMKNLNCFK